MDKIIRELARVRILPLVTISNTDQVIPLCDALNSGGMSFVEIAYRSSKATESIRIASQLAGMAVGAGTVTSIDLVKSAMDAGAQFIISPNFIPGVVEYCSDNGIIVFPGICTPSELGQVMEMGLSIVKFFPAEAFGGVKTIKAISAPFPEIQFVPAGGINRDNLASYLELPQVLCCSGSWMVSKDLIEKGEFEKITHGCLKTLEISEQLPRLFETRDDKRG